MDVTTYTQVRKNFASAMDRVCDDHEPLVITRQKERPVVMMSLSDYNAIKETLYLMKSPKNAEHLLRSFQDIESGKVQERDLIECD